MCKICFGEVCTRMFLVVLIAIHGAETRGDGIRLAGCEDEDTEVDCLTKIP